MKSRPIHRTSGKELREIERIGVFFDRDGTINTEIDFLTRPEEVRLIPQAARAIREANELGVKVLIITNQSGIARGLLTESDLSAIHKRLIDLLYQEGARLDGIYYCPHHPDYGLPPYKKVCNCRKPQTGMLEQAADEHRIDLRKSFVIGDRCVDMMAGKSAGCGTALVLTGYGTVERDECVQRGTVNHVAATAYEAWRYVKQEILKRHANT